LLLASATVFEVRVSFRFIHIPPLFDGANKSLYH